MLESSIWIWLSGLVFALLHSASASNGCKQWIYTRGLKEPNYRLLYSLVAVLTTGIWAWYIHQLPDAPLYQTDGLIWWLLLSFQIIGALIALAAFLPIDGLVFLGLRQAKEGTDPFIISGIFKYIRHPMYAGVMLVLLAMPEQSWNGMNFSLLLCVYFTVGSRFEERRMLAEHPEYAPYQQRVAAFLPNFRS